MPAHYEKGEGGKTGSSYSHLSALGYSGWIVWRERKQFREKTEKGQGKRFAFSVLARNSFILMQTNYIWIVLFETVDTLSSLAMISNLVWHSVYTHSRKPYHNWPESLKFARTCVFPRRFCYSRHQKVCLITLHSWSLPQSQNSVNTSFPSIPSHLSPSPHHKAPWQQGQHGCVHHRLTISQYKAAWEGSFKDPSSEGTHVSDEAFWGPSAQPSCRTNPCIRFHLNRNQWMPNPPVASDSKTYPTKLNADLLTVCA